MGLVTPRRHGFGNPLGLLLGVLADDRRLQDRFAAARPVTEVACVGPLAVEARSAGLPGLLLAGDAAGFVGPLTGDGLRFALPRRSGENDARGWAEMTEPFLLRYRIHR